MSDAPKIVTFKELKNKKFRPSENLQDAYEEGITHLKSRTRRSNDPRFDPRIRGICVMEDWEFLSESNETTRQKVKTMLNKETDPEAKDKVKRAMHLLRQREATEKDRNFKRQSMKRLRDEQVEQLESGKGVKFLTRANLRKQMQTERLKGMSKKQQEKYLERKEQKGLRVDD